MLVMLGNLRQRMKILDVTLGIYLRDEIHLIVASVPDQLFESLMNKNAFNIE